MKKRLLLKISILGFIGGAIAVHCFCATPEKNQPLRKWTPEVSASRRIIYPDAKPIVSPDGRHFALVTEQRDFAKNVVWGEMIVYSTDDVISQLQGRGTKAEARIKVRMSSDATEISRRPSCAIFNVTWQDNSTLIFLGTGQVGIKSGAMASKETSWRGSTVGVYQLNILDGELTRLTAPEHDLQTSSFGQMGSYEIAGDTILYSAMELRWLENDDLGMPKGYDNRPLQFIRGSGAFGSGLWPFVRGYQKMVGVFSKRRGETVREVIPFTSVRNDGFIMKISPDGRWAVVSQRQLQTPSGWQRFTGLEAPYALLAESDAARLQKIFLVNLDSGTSQQIWQAPLGPLSDSVGATNPTSVYWMPDCRHFLLMNVCLPMGDSQPVAPDIGGSGQIVDYDITSKCWSVVTPLRSRNNASLRPAITWDEKNGEFTLRQLQRGPKGYEPIEATCFRFSSGRWQGDAVPLIQSELNRDISSQLEGGIQVTVRSGLNEPDSVVASDGVSSIVLIDSDSTLADVRLSHAELLVSAGKTIGVLTLPPSGRDGGPYPLVIQVYGSEIKGEGFQPESHVAGGGSMNSHSAQSLAAEGMAVLDLDVTNGLNPSDPRDFGKQPLAAAKAIDSAVELLDKQRLILPRRVGVMGFSNGGGQVFWAITNRGRVTPAAAIVEDSIFVSYGEEVSQAAIVAIDMYSRFYGGSFYDLNARERWLAHAPGFNINRVETPTLFERHGSLATKEGGLLEVVGAFKLNKREMDLVIVPNSAHQIMLPREWAAEMQLTLEWMSFWLQDREISPEKQEQYWYWRSLKKQRDTRWAIEGDPYDKKVNVSPEDTADAK